MYAMLGSRPDLTASISILSQFLEKPKDCHVELLQHVCQYMRANSELGIIYGNNKKLVLECFIWWRFTIQVSKWLWFHPCRRTHIMVSGKQSITAQSSAEAEYYAAGSAAN